MLKNKRLIILSIGTFLAFSLVFSVNRAENNPQADHTAVAHGAEQHNVEDHAAHPAEPHAEGNHAPEKLNAGKVIMEHVADAHGWHLWGHTELPLPVILYHSERGLSVFSSARFDHGHKTWGGYMLHEGKVVAVDQTEVVDAHAATVNEALTVGITDISITKNVATLFVVLILLMLIFTRVAKAYTHTRKGMAPTGLQNAIEPIIMFMRDEVIKPSIGHKYERYLPYLLTVFFFIWIANLLGLVPVFPGVDNLTGNISISMTLALFTFAVVTFSANKNYWEHVFMMPGVPKLILLLLTPIEILGVFLRPFVLMIRLFANITAGHIIALSFFCLIFIFGENGLGVGLAVSPLSLLFTVFMTTLELLVAFLQAYVFTMLSAVYIGAAVEEHHH
ncbi:MAG: F0F1 ATP synthase subunit A [Bacteroidota bacterium]